MTLFTIGHSTRPLEAFVALLNNADVTLLVDVRSVPRSRANPQFNADTLPDALSAAGIGYRHMKALGGCAADKKGMKPRPTGSGKTTGSATTRTTR